MGDKGKHFSQTGPFFLLEEGALEEKKEHPEVIACLQLDSVFVGGLISLRPLPSTLTVQAIRTKAQPLTFPSTLIRQEKNSWFGDVRLTFLLYFRPLSPSLSYPLKFAFSPDEILASW